MVSKFCLHKFGNQKSDWHAQQKFWAPACSLKLFETIWKYLMIVLLPTDHSHHTQKTPALEKPVPTMNTIHSPIQTPTNH